MEELDLVVLTHDIPAQRLEHGDLGTIVHGYADGQAWHRASEVNVLAPGIRGAEGEEKGKGVHREVGSGGSPIQTRGATHRNRRGGVVHPGRAGT